LVLPIVLYVAVLLLATIASVSPRLSWWGSYDRLQGAYTSLAYIAVFAAMAVHLRTRAQVNRIITIVVHTSIAVAVYGFVQAFGRDPIAWDHDVTYRISSTLGNAGSAAAYLAFAASFVLVQLCKLVHRLRAGGKRQTVGAFGYRILAFIGAQLFLISQIPQIADPHPLHVVQVLGFALAIAFVTTIWVLLATSDQADGTHLVRWAVHFGLAWLVLAGWLALEPPVHEGHTIGFWGGAVSLLFFLPLVRRPVLMDLTKGSLAWMALGSVLVLLLLSVVALLTRSRGPLVGFFGAILLFIDLFLARWSWRGRRDPHPHLRKWAAAGASVLAFQIAVVAGLAFLNFSNGSVAGRVRAIPYVGATARLVGTRADSWRARTLIWKGDAPDTGIRALMSAEPFRWLIGYGPETFFNEFSRFSPASLLRVARSRDASADRAHQAQLDELATKGLAGLVTQLFLFGSALALGLRRFWRCSDPSRAIIFAGCTTALASHVADGLTGIHVTSTLFMFWCTLALLLATRRLESAGPTDDNPVTTVPGISSQAERSRPRRWLILTFGALAIAAVWFGNLSELYANMQFAVGTRVREDPSVAALLVRCDQTRRAIALKKREDTYFAELGAVLIQLGYNHKPRSSESIGRSGESESLVDAMLGKDPSSAPCQALFAQMSGIDLLDAAQVALQTAHDLNPRNKDRAAYLARLFALEFQATDDPNRLQDALRWYREAARLAPNDPVILNQWATTVALLGDEHIREAETMLERSQALDPNFSDTKMRLGDLQRVTGRMREAAESYARAVVTNPAAVSETALESILGDFKTDPENLRALERALQSRRAKWYLDRATVARWPRASQRTSLKFVVRTDVTLGRIATALQDCELARGAFSDALNWSPNEPEAHEYYAYALSACANPEGARQQAQLALELAQTLHDDPRARRVADWMRTFAQAPATKSQ